MEFWIFSRQHIECLRPPDRHHFIISIRTPGDPNEAKLPIGETTRGVLHLQFHDLDNVPAGILVTPEEAARFGRQFRKVGADYEWDVPEGTLFDAKMGREVVEFAWKQRQDDRLDLALLHCDAGWSRSPAVAAGLMRTVFGEDDSIIFKRFKPNMRVYRNVLAAWENYVHGPRRDLG
jgi:predicted protein tyrosine phosphatase